MCLAELLMILQIFPSRFKGAELYCHGRVKCGGHTSVISGRVNCGGHTSVISGRVNCGSHTPVISAPEFFCVSDMSLHFEMQATQRGLRSKSEAKFAKISAG